MTTATTNATPSSTSTTTSTTSTTTFTTTDDLIVLDVTVISLLVLQISMAFYSNR